MNGEGFAFACWIRLNIMHNLWSREGHGWHCSPCRYEWRGLQRLAFEQKPKVQIVLKSVTYTRTSKS